MDQKRENLLNLALETPEEERMQTQNLNVGFDPESKSFEMIVKYHGNLTAAARSVSERIRAEELIAGYGILTVPEEFVDGVSALEEVEYLELPKRFFYDMDGSFLGSGGGASGAGSFLSGGGENPGAGSFLGSGGGASGAGSFLSGGGENPGAGVYAAGVGRLGAGTFDVLDSACFGEVTQGPPFLRGRGVLMLIPDSGIDWKRREFCNANGSTRIRYLWDQTMERSTGYEPPEGFYEGVEFSAEQINAALSMENPEEQFRFLPSIDVSGHGTAVAGIAAGADPETGYVGAAPEAELLVVKLGPASVSGFPRTTELMRAVTWGLRKAGQLQMPMVINLSFGNTYGAHDGSSLLERFLDNAAEIGRTVICVGSGNEGVAGGHAAGNVAEERRMEIAVAGYERNLRLQLWQNAGDEYRIYLTSPGGRRVELTAPIGGGKFTVFLEKTKILAYQGEPAPYAVAKELYLEFLPQEGNYITGGIWTLELEPVRVVTGQYYLYLSDSVSRNFGTFFFRPTPQVTLTIPSTAAKVITVGAYDSAYDAYADFSGRGYADSTRTIGVLTAGLVKPDIAAPGVNIAAPDLTGGYTMVTGTSFATPIAAGAAALLMEWGVVRGNDPFLYGEKVKAYLRAGARALRGEVNYPNDRVGFGALCVKDSLP